MQGATGIGMMRWRQVMTGWVNDTMWGHEDWQGIKGRGMRG